MIEPEYTEFDDLLSPTLTLDDEALYNDLGKYGKSAAPLSARTRAIVIQFSGKEKINM